MLIVIGDGFTGILTWNITRPYFHWELSSIYVIDIILYLAINADINNTDLNTAALMLMNTTMNLAAYLNALPLYKISSLANQNSDIPSVIIKKTVEEIMVMEKFEYKDKFQSPLTGVYYYIESRSEVSWDMANKICEQNHQSQLLSINSENEAELLKGKFHSSPVLDWSQILFLELHAERQVREHSDTYNF